VEETAVEVAVSDKVVDATAVLTEITAVDRRGSTHATRKIEMDEEYDDEEEL
jgi:hypothetical protein